MFSVFFKSKLFTVLATVVVFLLAFAFFRVWPQKTEVERQLGNLREKIAETEKSNSGLKKLESYFKSRSYLEKEAKLKLNVRRPDENVIFIFEDPKAGDVQEETQTDSFEFGGLVGRLVDFEKWLKSLFE